MVRPYRQSAANDQITYTAAAAAATVAAACCRMMKMMMSVRVCWVYFYLLAGHTL